MTKEEALETLKNTRAGLYCAVDGNPTIYADALEMAIKALEQTRWIPCSERLPGKDGCYLVSTTGTNNDIIDIAYYTDGIWHKASRIKAWMPLPSSYQGGESDDE